MIDQSPHLGRRAMAAVGQPGDELLVEVGVERLRHLSMRRRERMLGERVRRRLVVADVQRIRHHAHFIEGPAQEELVARNAGEIERRRRHQEDLVAGAGQVVVLIAAELEVGDDRLLRLLELDDRLPHFLHLAPQGGAVGRTDDDARHPPIDTRLAQRVDDRAHRWRSFEELTEHTARLDLLQIAADAEQQRGVGRDLRRPAHRQAHDEKACRRDGDGDEDQDDDDDDAASNSHRGLLRSSIASAMLNAAPSIKLRVIPS